MKKLLKLTLLYLLAINISFALDQDNDGVDDSKDKCPNTAQLKMVDPSFTYAITVNPERLGKKPKAWPVLANGCEPDSDGDGVKNSQDYCPQDSKLAISKGVAKNGCPIHSDKDGTPDYRDKCPNTSVGVVTDQFGCPKSKANQKKEIHISKRIQKIFVKKKS